jgi:hypothetical protein
MRNARVTLVGAIVLCVALLGSSKEAEAQAAASSAAASSAAASSATASGMGMGTGMGMGGNGMNLGMGMGMGVLPFAYALNPSATLSPTDAAALGMPASPGVGMAAQVNSLMANPMAAPMIYGGINSMSPNQMGMMALASQAQMSGIGSGQLSGVRGGGRGRGQTPQALALRPRGTSNQPGGLAGRYFHRTTTEGRNPQIYYNQQSRYFPQIAR